MIGAAPGHLWEGLSRRMAPVLAAGLVNLEDGAITARSSCSCGSCRAGEVELRRLLAPTLRPTTEALIARLVEFRHALWISYDLACGPGSPSAQAAAEARALECQRLVDEIGVSLADVARRMILREYGDRTGRWPFCAVGQHPADCGCADAPERA